MKRNKHNQIGRERERESEVEIENVYISMICMEIFYENTISMLS